MKKLMRRLIYISFLFLSTVLFFSCREKKKFAENKNLKTNSLAVSPKAIKKPSSPSNDTLIIKLPSAILFTLDSFRWEKVKNPVNYMEHESTEHECFSLLNNTRASLHQYWPQLKIYEVTTTRYLLFISPDESRTCIDLDSISYHCGTYFFSLKKPPLLSDMMNIGNDMDYYFNK